MSLKVGYIGIIYGSVVGVTKGDTRSIDYGLCAPIMSSCFCLVVCLLSHSTLDPKPLG